MTTFIIYGVVFFIALYFARSKWTSERVRYETEFLKKRNRFLEVSRLLEEKLLNSTVVNGNPVHDLLFKIIHYVKYRETYISWRMVFKLIFDIKNPKIKLLREELDNEITNSTVEIRALAEELFDIYKQLIIMRHWKMFLFLAILTAFRAHKPIIEKQTVEPTVERVVIYSAA